MSKYIGQVQLGNNQNERALIGSTLFGICDTAANTAAKIVQLAAFDALTPGVTVYVRFVNGNTVASNVTLTVGGTSAHTVSGSCLCAANDVLSFTYDDLVSNGTTYTHASNDSGRFWRTDGVVVQAASASPNNVGSSAAVGTSNKYAREDHQHAIVVGEGDNNGQVKIAGQNASVKGLGTAAYTAVGDYATSAQGTLADNAMPKSGGTFTGSVILNGAPVDNLEAATKAYVDTEISNALTGTADAMVFKGTLGAAAQNPTITSVPTNSYSIGDTYRIVTAGTYLGERCEVGDLIIAIKKGPATGSTVITTDWTIAQGNIDGAVIGPSTATISDNVALFDGTTGKLIKDSGKTLGKSVPSGAVFTDTTYTITDGTAYTSHELTGASGSSILASVSLGVLTLAEGIKFTTGAVGASLNATQNGSNT